MAAELRVTLRGDPGAMDARRVLGNFTEVIKLLEALEDVFVGGDREPAGHSSWGIAHLALGSAKFGIAPLELRGDASWDLLDRIEESVLDGFAVTEREARLPDGWSEPAGQRAQQAAAELGTTAEHGMRLTLLVDGVERRSVEVTRRSSENLKKALRDIYESIGSITGVLGSITVYGRNQAGVWLDHPRGRGHVQVRFPEDMVAAVRGALGSRVTIRGVLRRNASGQILSVKMRGLDIEHTVGEGPKLADLVGLDPNFTGDQSTAEYIEEMRGTS